MAGLSIEWKPKTHPKTLLGYLLDVGMVLLPLPNVFILLAWCLTSAHS